MKSVSLPSNPEHLSRRDVIILAGAVLVALVIYLATSAFIFRIGFPLDDSWIHQTYARNFALHGEWSFVLGHPSGGSTSPLWTVLLAPGFLLGLSPYIWTYFLGAVLLFGLALSVEMILRRMVASYRPSYPWAGLLFAFEWHLAWAAFSGMETILHILFVVVVLGMLLVGSRSYLVMGVLCGASVWVRPDGLTLLGPLGLAALLNESTLSTRVRALTGLLLGFGALFAPYLFFNLAVAGTPMPNTFYAKQAEYAAWQAAPLGEKSLAFFIQFFAGVTLILLPAFIQGILGIFRNRDLKTLLLVAWTGGFIVLYTSRLPLYQHGRYIMPAMAVYLLVALVVFFKNLFPARMRNQQTMNRMVSILVVVFLLLSFTFGAYSFGMDVALIESQMVDTARWMDENIPAGSLVAAHDIGAIGYFSRISILDLAGLISPEVVPFINDDVRLAAFMDEHGADYFVAFSGWRPVLAARGVAVFETRSAFVPRFDLGSLTVYRWEQP
jgi:hypothetical protein